MQRGKTNTKDAGIDVGKQWLDAAVHGGVETVRHGNDAAGIALLIGWLQRQGVKRARRKRAGLTGGGPPPQRS